MRNMNMLTINNTSMLNITDKQPSAMANNAGNNNTNSTNNTSGTNNTTNTNSNSSNNNNNNANNANNNAAAPPLVNQLLQLKSNPFGNINNMSITSPTIPTPTTAHNPFNFPVANPLLQAGEFIMFIYI